MKFVSVYVAINEKGDPLRTTKYGYEKKDCPLLRAHPHLCDRDIATAILPLMAGAAAGEASLAVVCNLMAEATITNVTLFENGYVVDDDGALFAKIPVETAKIFVESLTDRPA